MKKVLSLLLTVLVSLSLCGCGGITGGSSLPARELAGRWSGEAEDISAALTALLSNKEDPEMQELLSYITLEKIYCVRELILDPDGRFTLSPTAQSLSEAVTSAETCFREGFDRYLYSAALETLAELGRTEAEYRAELGAAADEDLVAALGIDADALFEELAPRGRLEGLGQALSVSGSYELQNSELLLTVDVQTASARYDAENDSLAFSAGCGFISPVCFYRSN